MRGFRHSSPRRRLRVLAVAATAGAVSLVAGATTIGSSAQPGVTPTVVLCDAVITVDTKLASDLSNCPNDGVVIGRNGVTLDLNGHTIDGNDMDVDQGIDNTLGFDDLRVRGPGVIRDFDEEFPFRSRMTAVCSVKIVSNQNQGVLVVDSDENAIEDNFLSANGANGIFIMNDSNDGEVEDNVVSSNGLGGISIENSDGTQIDDNSVLNNGGSGLSLAGSDGNRLTENFVFNSVDHGVFLSDSSDNRIERNSALDNDMNGISVTSASNNNRIRRNSASDNGADGFSRPARQERCSCATAHTATLMMTASRLVTRWPR